MATVAFITLGCKVNIYESNALMNKFEEAGYLVVDEDLKADVYVINTCSVTNTADQKSRKMIHKARKLNSEAVVCVMGCFPQTHREAAEAMDIDVLLGNGNKEDAVELVTKALKTRGKINQILDIKTVNKFDMLEATRFDHTRAFVKIEDGCNNFCTYCIIPYARGPIRSKDHNKVIEELTKIASMGYEEVVFAGIHTGKYNSDGLTLGDLIEEVLIKVPTLKRLRLSSIEINEIDDKILSLMSKSKVIASHMHLPLQSGSDKILKLMNRKYDKAYFLDKIKKIREINPMISITTDVIVGFPYETEVEFKESMDFIKEVNFAELHVFPYSQRDNTPAAKMPQVDGNIKKQRARELIELSCDLNLAYNKKFIGTIQEVIVEQKFSDEYMVGHSSNYLKVFIPYDESLIKKMVKCEIIEVNSEKIIAKLV